MRQLKEIRAALAEIKRILGIDDKSCWKSAKRALYRWLLVAHPDKRQGRRLAPKVLPCSTKVFDGHDYWFTSAQTPGMHAIDKCHTYHTVAQPPSSHIHRWSAETVVQRLLQLKGIVEQKKQLQAPRAFVCVSREKAASGGFVDVRVCVDNKRAWTTLSVALPPNTQLPHIFVANSVRIYLYSRQ